MFTALQKLGYHPCHGTRMWDDPNKFLTLWMEAMRAKYFGEGERWGKREFDVVLGEFDVRIRALFFLCLSATLQCVRSRYNFYSVLFSSHQN